LNQRIKKLSILEEKLAQSAAIFIIVKFYPRILDINIWWFVVLLIICEIKPIYAIKK